MKKHKNRAARFVLRLTGILLTAGVLAGTCLVPSKVRAKEDPTSDFIDRAYEVLLNKKADGESFGFWYRNLRDGNTTAAGMLDSLTQSEDFKAQNYTNEQVLDVLGQVMTGQTLPDKTEYLRYLDNGVSVRRVVKDLSQTSQFASECGRYQVAPGSIEELDFRDQSPEVTIFVGQLFTELYGRPAVVEELNSWSQYFLEGKPVAPTLEQIVTSSDFTSKGYTDEQTIDMLCRLMLGRDADSDEKTSYLQFLDNGVSISYVMKKITESDDFTNRCGDIGLVQGQVTLSQPRDNNYELTSFLTRLYSEFAGVRPSAEDLNTYVKETLDDPTQVRNVVSQMLSSEESQALLESDDDFLNTVFRVLYGEEPSEEKVKGYKIGLSNGVTRTRVVSSILQDPAFDEKMKEYGIDTHVDPSAPKKVIALTFDDGPYTDVTMRILDALEPYGGHATFFVVGNRIKNYSECIVRAHNMGCEIADHTWSHQTLTRLSSDGVYTQINDCAQAVYNLIGVYPKVMRPVGGSYNSTVSGSVGMPMIIWSIDTNDWKYRDSNHVINEVLNNVRDGDIVLMHDLYETTATAVETIVPALVDAGYTLVTISELAEYKNIQMQDGKAYFSMRDS